MVTFAELRQAQPETYRQASRAWATLVEVIGTQGDTVTSRGSELGTVWAGPAATAATGHFTRLGEEFGQGAQIAGRIPAVLDTHAAAVAQAKATVDMVVSVLAPTPVLVSPAGTVSLSPAAYAVPAMVPFWQALAAQARTMINGAVQAATAADTAAAGQLNGLMPVATTTAATTSSASVPLSQVPAQGTNPQAVNDWWEGLSDEQRTWLLENHPERIGNLDGIPAVDRDAANRSVLATEQQRLEDRRDELNALGDDRNGDQDDELERINDQLTGITAINERLADTGPGKQQAFLLGFSTDGNGQAIVAMGNPDTADNIVTYVPGTTTRLGSIGGDLGRADIMVDSARAADPSESTSAIVWVGYEAPQSIINTDLGELGQDATNDRYAEAARDDLDRFQDGLRVTHEGERSHNTVLGHSYGSTVVGYTARDNGLDADELIFVGSPGVGVDNASQLGVDPRHVWSSTAANDPIQYGYNFGDLVQYGLGLDPQADLIHGANPSRAEFGGQVFASDPGDPLVRWTWEGPGPFDVIPVPHFSANAHSQYWDPGSASLENMGQIITGNRPTRN
ncbi:MAG TPA: alpha/beta hydrolase [Pseudonocardiaceae bacterium]